jgi:hypothetical protein
LKITGLLFFSLSFFDSNAQIFDTISASFHTKPKVFFQLDAYNSFVSDKGANTFGYKAGLEFNNRVKIGIGYYKLTSDIVRKKTLTYDQHIDTVQNAELDMNFIPVSFEYIFYNKDPWQFSVPINIGLGKSYFWYYRNKSGDRGEVDKKTVALMTVNLDAQYKIVKWVGIGAGLGFRVMLKDNNNINENFNSIIYSLQVRLFVDEIFKSLFPKKK